MTWTRAALCRMLPGLLAAWLTACVAEAPVSPKCTDTSCDENEEPVRCSCPDIYQPVCGKNGKTFGNRCEATCMKAQVAYEGECKGPEAPNPTTPAPTTPPKPAPGCVCPAIYKPVCGSDGKTYGNACEAGCATVPVASEGACADPSCICPAIYKPVCGTDGKTYGNACEAGCAKVPVVGEGACADGGSAAQCKSNAECTKGNVCYPPTHTCQPECSINCLVYDPVCGSDGKTYGCGKADAYCHGAEVISAGECPATGGCACTKEYKPVCGTDGITYGNLCMAKCAGVGAVSEGACAGGSCEYGGKQYKVGESFPSTDRCNTCTCTAGGQVGCTLKACLCDYTTPDRTWAAKSPEQCKLVKFACPAGKRPFFDGCGCGCEPDVAQCKIGGCSGQLCVGPGQPDGSTCEWLPQYACYKTASCGVQADGKCGWTQTDELRKCLETAR